MVKLVAAVTNTGSVVVAAVRAIAARRHQQPFRPFDKWQAGAEAAGRIADQEFYPAHIGILEGQNSAELAVPPLKVTSLSAVQ
jgi:hypothetical protein